MDSPQNTTLQMRKLRSIGFPGSQSYLSAKPLQNCWSASREGASGQPIRKSICQQLAANLLTNDLCPFVRNGTEGIHLVRIEHKACFVVSLIPQTCNAGNYGRREVMARELLRCFLEISSIIYFKHMVSLAGFGPH